MNDCHPSILAARFRGAHALRSRADVRAVGQRAHRPHVQYSLPFLYDYDRTQRDQLTGDLQNPETSADARAILRALPEPRG